MASLALTLTRFDGGVAFLWGASAVLLADLLREPRVRWIYSVVPCMIGSAVATSLFGLGWQVAPHFVLVNGAEALVAAWLLRRSGPTAGILGSLSSLARFAIAAGVVAPLVAATLAGVTLWGMDRSFGAAFVDVATGHALGNITFTPLAILVARGQLWRRMTAAAPRMIIETLALLMLTVAVSGYVFSQQSQPLLFLPVLPIIILAFRGGATPTAIAVVLLALIGGSATLLGMGPVALTDAALSQHLQFFQFYLATTVLTTLPVVADLEKRARLLSRIRISEERYRLIADHSTDIVLHLETDGRIRYVSPSIELISGHAPDALTGCTSMLLVAPSHRDKVTAAHEAVLAAAGGTQSFEYLGLAADGSERWFEAHSRVIRDEQGEVESVLSIARDISARKSKELRLASEAMTDPLTGLPNRRALHRGDRPLHDRAERGPRALHRGVRYRPLQARQ